MITSDNIGGKLDGEKADPGDDFGHYRKPSLMMAAELTGAVAQLRHAYAQLAAGGVINQKEFADGLISPQIATIEKVIRRLA
jgi:hypothetical protein